MVHLLARTHRSLILIVEDDAATGEVLSLAIRQETNHRPQLTTTGREALQLVQRIQPDLIILDYRLPDMNGIALYDQFQSIETLKSIPVILMSAARRFDEMKSRKMTFIDKPFDLDDFLKTVERLLASRVATHSS
jgi:DNA-binding NtrC family response regulator